VDALPATAFQVARQCGLNPDGADRMLRALGELGLVERERETWRATERGALLRSEHPLSMRDAALHWGRECYRLWEALPAAVGSTGTWTPPRFFEALAADPERVASYHRALAAYALHDYADLAEHLPELTQGVVLDAGGGSGTLLRELLRQRPGLRGVLLERPEVARGVEVPPELRDRLTVLPGDLFESWGTQADSVILARVLHDWEDEDALRILRRAREALRPGGTLHVIELVLGSEQLGDMGGGLLDLHMLVATGGRERTELKLRRLMAAGGFPNPGRRQLPGGQAVLTSSKGVSP
jgi:SAM-dependent methyltransferase